MYIGKMFVLVVKIKINKIKIILIKLLLCIESCDNFLLIWVRFKVFIIEYKIVIFMIKKDDEIILIKIYLIVFCNCILVVLIMSK